jgi:hypothetical protein
LLKGTMFVELRDCHLDDRARALASHLARRFDASAAVTPLPSREHRNGKWTTGWFLEAIVLMQNNSLPICPIYVDYLLMRVAKPKRVLTRGRLYVLP